MKKILMLTTVIGLLSTAIFASEKKINCDELARHIESKVTKEEHSDIGRFFGAFYSGNELMSSYFINGSSEITYKICSCYSAGQKDDSTAIKLLPDRIKLFQQYQNALKRCDESSQTPSKLAFVTRHSLSDRMHMSSQCIALYEKGKIEANQKHKEEVVKKETFENFIHDANKK